MQQEQLEVPAPARMPTRPPAKPMLKPCLALPCPTPSFPIGPLAPSRHPPLPSVQLSLLEFSDCMLDAVAAVPWQVVRNCSWFRLCAREPLHSTSSGAAWPTMPSSPLPLLTHLLPTQTNHTQVLPRLASLQEVAVERCGGAVLLPSLWYGLAGCSQLRRLSITGGSVGGGLPPPEPSAGMRLPGADAPPLAAACRCPSQALPGQPLHRPACPFLRQQQQAASGVPDAIALLQQLRRLDLSRNGLATLPDGVAWCQQLTAVCLAGNQLRDTPWGLAALGGLRKLDLSCNQASLHSCLAGWLLGCLDACGRDAKYCPSAQQCVNPPAADLAAPLLTSPVIMQLSALAPGPYLQHLDELQLGDNLALHPSALPLQLLAGRLRRLVLPLWWTIMGDQGLAPLLLALCPWLLLEHG